MDGGTQVVSRGQTAYFLSVITKSACYHARLTHEQELVVRESNNTAVHVQQWSFKGLRHI